MTATSSLSLPQPLLLTPPRFGDDRGWFSETWRKDRCAEAGITAEFVQDNQSFSVHRGTVRGLHCQLAPFAQAKLVRVLAGSIFDVVVDLRRSSPFYGRHQTFRLDAETGEQLFVPAGFAHGFCTLEPHTMVTYKVDAYYSREHDRTLLWNDPALGIAWPVGAGEAILSDKDRAALTLGALGPVFA
ncbi:dTDP-4-dehydrorhamnose 3,5-epimerase [Alsobacter sp. KACC 23698]|uniref:dTDP-4-dehydrorhamnose 3,5-epimerase n=1 Tax=Alsobacter sp. KACC 23698 TaxID=3149229 RepID=A0AAU7JJJ5_9HYPH